MNYRIYSRISRIERIFAQNDPKFIFLRLKIIKVNGLKRLLSKFSSFGNTLKKYRPNFIQNFSSYTLVNTVIIFLKCVQQLPLWNLPLKDCLFLITYIHFMKKYLERYCFLTSCKRASLFYFVRGTRYF
jgi:hypothetical protein